jgi:hypothetical protein
VAVDIGYYALGGDLRTALSEGTRQSLVGATLDDAFAFRGGRIRTVRGAESVRSFPVRGRERQAASVGAAEHFTLPAAYPRLQEVSVYLGWFGPLSRGVQAGALAASLATRLPGVRGALQGAGERLVRLAEAPDAGTTPGGAAHVVAIAYTAGREPLTEVHLHGTDPYDFTARFLAWAAMRAAGGDGLGDVRGAVGPLQAFGLEGLEEGVRAGGLERADA